MNEQNQPNPTRRRRRRPRRPKWANNKFTYQLWRNWPLIRFILICVILLGILCGMISCAVNAIGGLNKNNIDVLAGIPIAGICVVSAIMKAESPKTATIELKAKAKELGII